MDSALIYADTVRSPELRHEVPIMVPDAFLYVEQDGTRHIVVGSMEIPRLEALGSYELHPLEEFGVDELRRSGIGHNELSRELVARAVTALGVERAIVPGAFPLAVGDRLREAGVELVPDPEFFERRRRVKSGAEIAGIRRAQAAAEAGTGTARELLRRSADRGDGVLELDGVPLTSERLKAAITATFLEHGATWDELIVSHGPQAASGHDLGSGAIRAGEPIVVDVWPRDNGLRVLRRHDADVRRRRRSPTRWREWHQLCVQALGWRRDELRPGITARSLFDGVCDLFEAAGYPTQRTQGRRRDARQRVLPRPRARRRARGARAADPRPDRAHRARRPATSSPSSPALYRAGFGGCRLEDLVLVTDNGAERLTDFPYELTP